MSNPVAYTPLRALYGGLPLSGFGSLDPRLPGRCVPVPRDGLRPSIRNEGDVPPALPTASDARAAPQAMGDKPLPDRPVTAAPRAVCAGLPRGGGGGGWRATRRAGQGAAQAPWSRHAALQAALSGFWGDQWSTSGMGLFVFELTAGRGPPPSTANRQERITPANSPRRDRVASRALPVFLPPACGAGAPASSAAAVASRIRSGNRGLGLPLPVAASLSECSALPHTVGAGVF